MSNFIDCNTRDNHFYSPYHTTLLPVHDRSIRPLDRFAVPDIDSMATFDHHSQPQR